MSFNHYPVSLPFFHGSDLEDMDRDIAALQLTSDSSLINVDSTLNPDLLTQQALPPGGSRVQYGDISSPASDKDISLMSPDTAASQSLLYGGDDTDISEGSLHTPSTQAWLVFSTYF